MNLLIISANLLILLLQNKLLFLLHFIIIHVTLRSILIKTSGFGSLLLMNISWLRLIYRLVTFWIYLPYRIYGLFSLFFLRIFHKILGLILVGLNSIKENGFLIKLLTLRNLMNT